MLQSGTYGDIYNFPQLQVGVGRRVGGWVGVWVVCVFGVVCLREATILFRSLAAGPPSYHAHGVGF